MNKKKHSVTNVEKKKKSVTALPSLPVNFWTGFFTVMRIIGSFIVQYITGINNIYGDDNNENLWEKSVFPLRFCELDWELCLLKQLMGHNGTKKK